MVLASGFVLGFCFCVLVLSLSYGFRFWVQIQCLRSCDRDQHALTHVYDPCHLTNSTNWIRLMAK